MTEPNQIRSTLHASLRAAVPGAAPEQLADDADIREELDLDSMDFLNFVTAVHKALSIEIPERDYRQLATLRSAEAYLTSKLG